jgi:SAM-dependent methyltransferase
MSNDVREHASAPGYLLPYIDAAQRHRGGFRSLLWATRQTQATRFEALCRLENPRGRALADVGCGRADLLDFCIGRGMAPAHYTGIEALPELLAAAREKAHPSATIVAADFVRQPRCMFVGAELIFISGSLNTLEDPPFYATLRRAFDACGKAVVFNFLETDELAGAEYLRWRERNDVLAFAKSLSRDVRVRDRYISGDCSMAIGKKA